MDNSSESQGKALNTLKRFIREQQKETSSLMRLIARIFSKEDSYTSSSSALEAWQALKGEGHLDVKAQAIFNQARAILERLGKLSAKDFSTLKKNAESPKTRPSLDPNDLLRMKFVSFLVEKELLNAQEAILACRAAPVQISKTSTHSEATQEISLDANSKWIAKGTFKMNPSGHPGLEKIDFFKKKS